MNASIPRNLYEQQSHNRRLTIMVMMGFGLFTAFLGFGVDAFILGTINENAFFPIGTLAGLVVGTVSAVWSMKSGVNAVVASTGALDADAGVPAQQQLINVVDEMRIASGLPMPRVMVIPDLDPNAFATGMTPETSVVAVTQGLLDTLNREELQGVIAHEMSHIRNLDIRLMTVVSAMVGTVLILSDVARRSLRFGGGSRNSGSSKKSSGSAGILLVVWIIALILAPFIARILAMMVSRKREFLADASAAELTRNPLGLASALQKLESAVAPTAAIKQATAHLCIVDPLGRAINAKEGKVADLFGTHPPIEQRIRLLQGMAYVKAGESAS